MLRSFFLLCATLAAMAVAAPAQADTARIEALSEAMGLPEVIEIMRTEGLAYGSEIGESLIPMAGRGGWSDTVDRIYGTSRMYRQFFGRFAAELEPSGDGVDAMLEFFTSDLGSKVIGLELSARRAMLDEDIDTAAKLMLGELMAGEDPRIDQLRRFVEANDLLEENVVGGLNATYAFYMGLVDGGAPGFDIGQDAILADVWAQEPGIREDLEEWLYSYLALAYRPLGDEDLAAYVAFSETHEGRALNSALFAAFHAMFAEISGELGREAGRILRGQDI